MLLYIYLYVYNYMYMYIYMSCLICCCACALYMFHRGRVGNVLSIPFYVLTCKGMNTKATFALTLTSHTAPSALCPETTARAWHCHHGHTSHVTQRHQL